MSRLRASGVAITIATHDTTTAEGVSTLLSGNVTRPVTAVFHLAGVLRDGLLENLTVGQFEEVFAAKVHTAQHLDTFSRVLCPDLEHFVCFSSVVSGRGNSGQSNYAAANSTLERICEGRVSEGLPGLAIQWGAIGDVGMAHSMVGNDANIGGTYPQRIWGCLSTMSRAMTLGAPVVSSIVLADKENKSKGDGGSDLVTVVSNIMGASDPSKLDHNTTLGDLGLDSLMGVEVKQALDRAEIRLSSKDIRNLTLKKIHELQCGEQGEPAAPAPKEAKKDEQSCIVELKRVPDTTPLYLIHPVTLELAPLHNVASHLNTTVLAVSYTDKAPLDSLEALASYYHSEISKHRKGGRFRLGGYSFGAMLAFEICLQMSKDELSGLEYLVLIDGSPNWVRGQIEGGKELALRRSGKLDKPTEAVLGFVRRMLGCEPDGLYEKIIDLSPDVEAQAKVITNYYGYYALLCIIPMFRTSLIGSVIKKVLNRSPFF